MFTVPTGSGEIIPGLSIAPIGMTIASDMGASATSAEEATEPECKEIITTATILTTVVATGQIAEVRMLTDPTGTIETAKAAITSLAEAHGPAATDITTTQKAEPAKAVLHAERLPLATEVILLELIPEIPTKTTRHAQRAKVNKAQESTVLPVLHQEVQATTEVHIPAVPEAGHTRQIREAGLQVQ